MVDRLSPVRVLVLPGLHDSGPLHWQSGLQAHFRGALRVRQDDWQQADVDRWAERVHATVAPHRGVRWVAVAHSFGCLALARYLAQGGQAVHAALFVAPADPHKFGIAARLPQASLGLPAVLIGSQTDPWMQLDAARGWARRWGAQFVNLGDAGHINVDSGHGPLPRAKAVTRLLIQRVERQARLARAHPLELSFAI